MRQTASTLFVNGNLAKILSSVLFIGLIRRVSQALLSTLTFPQLRLQTPLDLKI